MAAVVHLPVEKAGADAVLQARELLRQRRLGETKLLAGAGERRGLGDGEENAKLMKRHCLVVFCAGAFPRPVP